MQTTSFTHIAELVEVLIQNNITKVVLSPGSRNAPLIIAFDSHKSIETFVIHDERSAGFFALGLADELQQGVAVVCTSGSALLNYSPAVVEAHYRQVPLLILSADRPLDLIDQGDGQCMQQYKVFDNFIKKSCQLDRKTSAGQVKLAIHELLSLPKGPVHINIPLAEPLYELGEFTTKNNYEVDKKEIKGLTELEKIELETIWTTTSKKLIIVGQMIPNQKLQLLLDVLANDSSVAILTENTSNSQKFTKFCHSIDRTLAVITENEIQKLKPELIVSIGGAIISKKIKQFFRHHKPKHNWRVGVFTINEDTYQSKTKSIEVSPEVFVDFINNIDYQINSNFGNFWKTKDFLAFDKHQTYISQIPYSDLAVFDCILDTIPEGVSLQMANSSVVRYCQLFNPIKSVSYFGNRGVSGIDGSTSTALGMAVANPSRLVVLITGDISFFYDSNALWNSYLPPNFRIILINNNGGGIFNIIDGPKQSQQNKLFVAPHKAKVKDLCQAFYVGYFYANSIQTIESQLADFYTLNNQTCVMEIDTSSQNNGEVLSDYFKALV